MQCEESILNQIDVEYIVQIDKDNSEHHTFENLKSSYRKLILQHDPFNAH